MFGITSWSFLRNVPFLDDRNSSSFRQRRVPMNLSTCQPENIGWFIEDQAFLRSYDLAASPLPLPSSPVMMFLFLSLTLCRRSSILTGEGRDREKAWSSINNWIISDTSYDRDILKYRIKTISYFHAGIRMAAVLLVLEEKGGLGDGEGDYIDDKDVSCVTVSKAE